MPPASPPAGEPQPLRQPLRLRCEVNLRDRDGVLRTYMPTTSNPIAELPVLPEPIARQLIALNAATEPPEETDATDEAPGA